MTTLAQKPLKQAMAEFKKIDREVDLLKRENDLRKLHPAEQFKVDYWLYIVDLDYQMRLSRALDACDKRAESTSLSDRFMRVASVDFMTPNTHDKDIERYVKNYVLQNFEKTVARLEDPSVLAAKKDNLKQLKIGLGYLKNRNAERLKERQTKSGLHKNTVAAIRQDIKI